MESLKALGRDDFRKTVLEGRLDKGIRDLLAYCLRYQAQTYGYLLLLTQRYPSFSDE